MADETPETITIFITEAETSPVRLNVNDVRTTVAVGVEATIPAIFRSAMEGAADTIKWRYAGESLVPSDEGDDGEAFDAEGLIIGTLDDIIPLLDELTNEQLQSVLEAEADREVPRKGIRDAVEKVIAGRNAN